MTRKNKWIETLLTNIIASFMLAIIMTSIVSILIGLVMPSFGIALGYLNLVESIGAFWDFFKLTFIVVFPLCFVISILVALKDTFFK